jgi:hypothetical protein
LKQIDIDLISGWGEGVGVKRIKSSDQTRPGPVAKALSICGKEKPQSTDLLLQNEKHVDLSTLAHASFEPALSCALGAFEMQESALNTTFIVS